MHFHKIYANIKYYYYGDKPIATWYMDKFSSGPIGSGPVFIYSLTGLCIFHLSNQIEINDNFKVNMLLNTRTISKISFCTWIFNFHKILPIFKFFHNTNFPQIVFDVATTWQPGVWSYKFQSAIRTTSVCVKLLLP